MIQVEVSDNVLRRAVGEGMDGFVQVFVDRIYEAIGGQLTEENMQELTPDQITLLAYIILRDEVMDGGFVQLIHNGYGEFIFKNPFAKAVKAWGMKDLCRMVYDVHTLYAKHGNEIARDCSDEEFMALFEQYPEFDKYDDEFVENEERFTGEVAAYIDSNIANFAQIV